MYRTLLLAAAALAPAPCLASEPAGRRADLHGGVMRFHQASGRYCLTDWNRRVMSALPRVECMTAAQWKEEGLTVSRRPTAAARAAMRPVDTASVVGPAGLEPAT